MADDEVWCDRCAGYRRPHNDHDHISSAHCAACKTPYGCRDTFAPKSLCRCHTAPFCHICPGGNV